MLWWLSASDKELEIASTCMVCGCRDADIDTQLCYQCFCVESNNKRIQQELENEQQEEYFKLMIELVFGGVNGEGI